MFDPSLTLGTSRTWTGLKAVQAEDLGARVVMAEERGHLVPLDHLPNPSKRFKVLAYTRRGVEIYVEVMDGTTKQGVMMPLIEALQVAADINLEVARLLNVVADQMANGTIPEFERRVAEWGPHGEGTAT
jgi:hypothetical protein